MQKKYPSYQNGDKELDRFIRLVKAAKTEWEKLQIIPEIEFTSDAEARLFFDGLIIELLQKIARLFFLMRDQHGFDIGKSNLGLWPFVDEEKPPYPALYDLLSEYKFYHAFLEKLYNMTTSIYTAKVSLCSMSLPIIRSLNQWSCRAWPIIVFNLRPSWALRSERYIILLAGWVATQIRLTTERGATKRFSVALSRRYPGIDARDALLATLPSVVAEFAAITTDNAGNISSDLAPGTLSKLRGKAEYAIEKENLSEAENIQEAHRKSENPLKGPTPQQAFLDTLNKSSSPRQLEEWAATEDYSSMEISQWLESVGLTVRQLTVFNLCSIEEKSAEEAAQILDMKPATVRSTNRAARNKIKPKLEMAIKLGEMSHKI